MIGDRGEVGIDVALAGGGEHGAVGVGGEPDVLGAGGAEHGHREGVESCSMR